MYLPIRGCARNGRRLNGVGCFPAVSVLFRVHVEATAVSFRYHYRNVHGLRRERLDTLVVVAQFTQAHTQLDDGGVAGHSNGCGVLSVLFIVLSK